MEHHRRHHHSDETQTKKEKPAEKNKNLREKKYSLSSLMAVERNVSCWLARETNKMWPQFVFSHKKMCFAMRKEERAETEKREMTMTMNPIRDSAKEDAHRSAKKEPGGPKQQRNVANEMFQFSSYSNLRRKF